MLQKTTELDQIEVLPNAVVQVRWVVRVLENNSEISKNYTREVLVPGSDVSNAHPMLKSVCAAIWTDEAVAAYQQQQLDKE
jgi:hypothetical protein